jgi:hypothetical protein
MLSQQEILSRCGDMLADAAGDGTEQTARLRGGRFFVGLHSLVNDAGGPQAVSDAASTATKEMLDEAGLTSVGATTINPANIIALIQEIMAMISGFKPPVPVPPPAK